MRRLIRRLMSRSGEPTGKPVEPDPTQRIGIRTHVEPEGWSPPVPFPPGRWPSVILVLHTVPFHRPGQPLRFAVWMLSATRTWEILDRGVILGNDLTDQARQGLLRAGKRLSVPEDHFTPQHHFGTLIHRVSYQRRAALVAWDISVDMGRLATDWGRSNIGPTRNGISMILSTTPDEPTERQPELRNGETENVFNPRFQSLSLGEGRAVTGYSIPKNLDSRDRKGTRRRISLRPIAESLSGMSPLTGAEAADLWDIPSPEPERPATDLSAAFADLARTSELARVLFEEHYQIQKSPPGTTTSPGTYARGFFDQMRLKPPLVQNPDFPRPILAGAMGASFAGDVFTHARSRKLPIRKTDLGSAYLVAFHSIDAWRLYSAKSISVHDRDPQPLVEYVERLARRVERWWNNQIPLPLTSKDWTKMGRTLVWVDAVGATLPHRPRGTGRRDQGAHMQVGPLTSCRAVPMYLADVLRATLVDGVTPRIVRAVRLIPHGRQQLKAMRLPTGRLIDPNSEDPVFALALERLRLENDPTVPPKQRKRWRGALKGIAVSAGFGLSIQVIDEEPWAKPQPMMVWDSLDPDNAEPEVVMTPVIERPGPYYFPPIGASVAAAGRLLLHLCRGAFDAAGGTVAYWDTDSLFIIATPRGGELIPFAGGSETTSDGRPGVRALSFRQVHEIQTKIETALSPYPEDLRPYTYDLTGPIATRVPLPALLKSEPENQAPPEAYGLPVEGPFYDGNRPKRYRIYHILTQGAHIEIHDGTPVVVEPTADELQRLSRVVVTNPSLHGITYQKPQNAPDDYIERLMAFHLEEHLQIGDRERPEWADETAISLVAATRVDAIDLHADNRPYSRIAVATSLFGRQVVAAYPGDDWVDGETGTPVTFDLDPESQLVLDYQVPRSLDFQIRRNTASPPAHTVTHDGLRVGARTEGLLKPAPTVATAIDIIGRESRRWGDGRGILTPPDINTYTTRTDPEAVARLLRKHYHWPGAARLIAEKTGLSERTVRAILAGKKPSPRSTELLWEFAYQQKLGFDEEGEAKHV